MPGLTRVGDLESGHDGYEPVRLATGSPNVFINGRRAGRVGDVYEAHGGHRDVITSGSPSIFINGRPAARIGDSVAGAGGTGTVAQGSGNVFCGEDSDISRINAMDIVWQIFMRRLRKTVDTSGTPTDKLLLCLPHIAEIKALLAVYQQDSQGWSYLHDMFVKWFSGAAWAEVAPFWVNIDWALSYERAQDSFNKLKGEKYLFSPKAQNKLAEILNRHGKLQDSKVFFDYTTINWPQWEDAYFQQIGVNYPPEHVDGLTLALGRFNFRALARGYTDPVDGGHRIVVQGVAIFIRDSFDFEEDQYLFAWRCSPPDMAYAEPPTALEPFIPGYINLRNSDFRKFREDFCRGGDFLVLSEPKCVDFQTPFSYVSSL